MGHREIPVGEITLRELRARLRRRLRVQRARELGAWETVNYRDTPDWQHRVLELTGGQGADRIVEVELGGNLEASVPAIRVNGTIASYASQADPEPTETRAPYSGKPGTNHLGYEVDDVEALRSRLAAAGYHESTVPNSHPHRRRVYFYDAEGNDWEFVQYLSDDLEERNDYSQ